MGHLHSRALGFPSQLRGSTRVFSKFVRRALNEQRKCKNEGCENLTRTVHGHCVSCKRKYVEACRKKNNMKVEQTQLYRQIKAELDSVNTDQIYEEALKKISMLIHAFGACTHCYGKGYGTQTLYATSHKDFGDEQVGTTRLPKIVPCRCERGREMRKLLNMVGA